MRELRRPDRHDGDRQHGVAEVPEVGERLLQDLAVVHRAKGMPAARCSTGEQKALLLGLILAHADLVADRRGEPPILLLDEVAAHLDPGRRAALFERLAGAGQVWMTGTEPELFAAVPGDATRYSVAAGAIG